MKAGKISEGDLAAARARQTEHGDRRRLGEILIEMSSVTARDLERQVRLQIEAVVFELMSWREGNFRFEEARSRTCPRTVGGEHLDRVAADGRRAPHRRVVADRRPCAEPFGDCRVRRRYRRPRGTARPAAERVGGADEDRRRARPASPRVDAGAERIRRREDRVRPPLDRRDRTQEARSRERKGRAADGRSGRLRAGRRGARSRTAGSTRGSKRRGRRCLPTARAAPRISCSPR